MLHVRCIMLHVRCIIRSHSDSDAILMHSAQYECRPHFQGPSSHGPADRCLARCKATGPQTPE